jgi:hypothetical protein
MNTKIYILLIGALMSCELNKNQNAEHWETFESIGLKQNNEEFSKMLFLNEKVGVLAGTNYNDKTILEKKFNEQNAVIYLTGDGGRTWKESILGKGRIVDLTSAHDTLFSLCNNTDRNFYSLIDSSTIYTSINRGQSWNAIHKFPFYIRDIRFLNSLEGIAIGRDMKATNVKWQILRTHDGGARWQTVSEESDIAENPTVTGKDLIYFSSNNNVESGKVLQRRLVQLSLADNSKQFSFLPAGFDPILSFLVDGNLWLAGAQGSKTSIISLVKNQVNIIKQFEEPDQFPKYFYSYGGKSIIVLSRPSSFSTRNTVFSNSDGGKTWIPEQLPIDDYGFPISSYHHTTWIYSGSGRIQKRE